MKKKTKTDHFCTQSSMDPNVDRLRKFYMHGLSTSPELGSNSQSTDRRLSLAVASFYLAAGTWST